MMLKGQALWVGVYLKGCQMIKLNLSFFYQVGLQVGRLANMPIGTTRLGIAMQANTAESYTRTLIANPGMPLRACRNQGESLLAAIAAMHRKILEYIPADPGASPEEWNMPITWQDTEFNDVLNIARTFETVLTADDSMELTPFGSRVGSRSVRPRGASQVSWLVPSRLD